MIPALPIATWLRLGAALAVILALAWSHACAYQAGRAAGHAAVARDIENRNEEAGDAAETWRGRYRECLGAGGLYDFETGACDR